MNKLILFLFSFFWLGATSALDLYQSYQKALEYNADYLKAIALRNSGVENKNLALAALLPQFNINGILNENYFNQGGINATFHQPIYSASLNQVVFDFSKFSTYIKGKYAADLADLQLKNAKEQLILSVAKAYFDVLYAEDSLSATKMTKEALFEQMNQAQAAFKVGSVTIADVNDAKAAYDAAVADEITETNNLISKQNIFKNITGLDARLIQSLSDVNLLNLAKPQNPESWVSLAKASNLNVLTAKKQLQMAKEDIQIARSGHYPTLNLIANVTYQDTGNIDNTNATPAQLALITYPGGPLSNYTTSSIMLRLSVPISNGGLINAKTRAAISNYESSMEQYYNIDRTTTQNVKNAYWQVENGVALVKAQKSALVSARTKLDSDKLGYQVGIRNSVDLVDSQKNYYQAFRAYQLTRYQYLNAKLNLAYLGGKIDFYTLKDINNQIQN